MFISWHICRDSVAKNVSKIETHRRIEGVFPWTCPIIIYAYEVPEQKTKGLERVRGRQEEMAEAEEELFMEIGLGDGHGLAWTFLREHS
jgi:hypothetical protein